MQMIVILVKVLAAASWRGPRLPTTSALASAAAPSAAAQHWPPAETSGGATLTYLEINGWLISANGVTVLVDPVLEGRLDFGIPALYAASKRVLPESGSTSSLPPLDALLITQGLDDHAHARTLARLAELDPTLPILAPPSALPALERAFGRGVVQCLASPSRRIELPYLGLSSLPTVRLPADASHAAEAVVRPRRGGGGAGGARGGGLACEGPEKARGLGFRLRPSRDGNERRARWASLAEARERVCAPPRAGGRRPVPLPRAARRVRRGRAARPRARRRCHHADPRPGAAWLRARARARGGSPPRRGAAASARAADVQRRDRRRGTRRAARHADRRGE
mmetsp:Transcript_41883/g.132218  ORF Transcript_41883/g.132218 Transcript_41883/m.132218 type:complete len:340 (+) Transcript_41883:100-1119(+)